MELLIAQASWRAAKADARQPIIEGWASVYDTLIDAHVPTRIRRGAFTKTLAENRKRIKVLYQHDPDRPIGVPTELRDESRGLYMKATLATTPLALEVAELCRAGILTELSIGFDVVRQESVNEQHLGVVRHIHELRLWEISAVTFAANRDAVITAVHRRSGRAAPTRPTSHGVSLPSRAVEDVHSGLALLRELQVLSLEQSIAAWKPRFAASALQSRVEMPEHVSRQLNDLNHLEVRALEKHIASWGKP